MTREALIFVANVLRIRRSSLVEDALPLCMSRSCTYTESLLCGKQLGVPTLQAQWYRCRHCWIMSSCKGRRGAGSSCPIGNHPSLLTSAPSRDTETIILLLMVISQCTGHAVGSAETSLRTLPMKYHVECSRKYISARTESSQRPRSHQLLVTSDEISLRALFADVWYCSDSHRHHNCHQHLAPLVRRQPVVTYTPGHGNYIDVN